MENDAAKKNMYVVVFAAVGGQSFFLLRNSRGGQRAQASATRCGSVSLP
jgi:hypothetical protein